MRSELCTARPRLTQILDEAVEQKSNVWVIGSAGQGKTSLVQNWITGIQQPYLWFQLTEADRDPICLFKTLYQGFAESYPAVRDEAIFEVIETDTLRCDTVEVMTEQICELLKYGVLYQTTVVIDDFHLVDTDQQALGIIQNLKTCLAPLHWVVIGRHGIVPHMMAETDVCIDNDQLSLTEGEVIETLSQLELDASHLFCDFNSWLQGWPLGWSLIGKWLREHPDPSSARAAIDAEQAGKSHFIVRYCEEVVLAPLSEMEREWVVSLSLGSAFSSDFAKKLTGHDYITAFLHNRNLFLVQLPSGEYRYHHLIQYALKSVASRYLKQPALIYKQWSDTELAAGNIYAAVEHLIKAGLEEQACILAGTSAIKWVLAARHKQAAELVDLFPSAAVSATPWLLLAKGCCELLKQPQNMIEKGYQALDLFDASKDPVGRFACLVMLIHTHGSIDGEYQKVPPLMIEAETLYTHIKDHVPFVFKAMALVEMAGTRLLLEGDAERSFSYLTEAIQVARRERHHNLHTMAQYFAFYHTIVTHRFDQSLDELEALHRIVGQPSVSPNYRAFSVGAQLNWLHLIGEDRLYRAWLERHSVEVNTPFFNAHIMAPYLNRWLAQSYLREGNIDKARSPLERTLKDMPASRSPNIRSQMLQYLAIVEASEGNEARAFDLMRESKQLRDHAGEINQKNYNLIALAQVCLLLGRYDEGLDYIHDALEISRRLKKHHLSNAAFLIGLAIAGQKEDEGRACEFAEQFNANIDLTPHQAVDYSLGILVGALIENLHRIKIPSKGLIAWVEKKAGLCLSTTGSWVPQLKIITSPLLCLEAQGKLVQPNELSPLLRSLLSLLIVAPNMTLRAEAIMLNLWPDESKEKARSSLDTAIKRLRDLLSKGLGIDAKQYLQIKNGVVSLAYTDVDLINYLDLVQESTRAEDTDKNLAARLWRCKAQLAVSDPSVIDIDLNLESVHRFAVSLERISAGCDI